PVARRELEAVREEEVVQVLLHGLERPGREAPERHARLVAHEDQLVAQPLQQEQRIHRPRPQADARAVDVVRHVLDQRAVLVQEDGALHGHDVSRMGITMTSGITLSSGMVRTNRTACATLAGSWSVAASMSGKRSRRKGVRMPPGSTALTLMLCGRSSACMACENPSRPHFVVW